MNKTKLKLSKITKEHMSLHFCCNIIFLTLSKFLSASYKQLFIAKLLKIYFFSQDFLKKKLKIKLLQKGKCFFCCNLLPLKWNCVLLKITCPTFQNSYFAKFLHDFQLVVFEINNHGSHS